MALHDWKAQHLCSSFIRAIRLCSSLIFVLGTASISHATPSAHANALARLDLFNVSQPISVEANYGLPPSFLINQENGGTVSHSEDNNVSGSGFVTGMNVGAQTVEAQNSYAAIAFGFGPSVRLYNTSNTAQLFSLHYVAQADSGVDAVSNGGSALCVTDVVFRLYQDNVILSDFHQALEERDGAINSLDTSPTVQFDYWLAPQASVTYSLQATILASAQYTPAAAVVPENNLLIVIGTILCFQIACIGTSRKLRARAE